MGLFACRNCLCIENTALCSYWQRVVDKEPLLCSACDPSIGRWHNIFKQRSANGMLVDSEGNLWSSDSDIPSHKHILGQITENE
jgi:hypothetical protein